MIIKNVFSNTYGLARSLLALSTLLTLSFTNPHYFFNEVFFKVGQPQNTVIPNFFYLFGEEGLGLAVLVASFILLWVISGYLPQVTGLLHAWVAYSFFTGSIIIEGGDQINQIITILLIPITLLDKRLNHWGENEFLKYKRPDFIRYFCYSIIIVIQIQMAALYLFAGAEKLAVTEWSSGSAFYYWFNHVPFGATDTVKTLFSPLVSSHIMSPLITWGVILLEVILFAAFFMTSKKRKVLFFFGLFFHFMIVVVHGLASFFLAMTAGLILYLLPCDGLNFKTFVAKIRKPVLALRKKNKLAHGKPALIFLPFLLLNVSCDNENEISQQNVPVIVQQSLDYLKDSYYWEHLIPGSLQLQSITTPQALIEEVKAYSPVNTRLGIPADRWSFAIKNDEWIATLNGNVSDFGIGMRFFSNDDLRISWVQPNSAAGQAGLKRGMKVTSINNIAPVFEDIEILLEILSTQNEIELEIDNSGQNTTYSISKDVYDFAPIIKHNIFEDANEEKTAYLNLISFTGNTRDAFSDIFSEFKNENIEKLIIDLRYNGGGLLSAMQNLAGYLVPDSRINEVFYKIEYNKNYEAFDENIFFEVNQDRLNLRELIFITGPGTASSSEILINAMIPHINTTIIGLATNGKFFGMQPKTIEDQTIVAVSFATLNIDQQEMDVSYQIIPDIEIGDDLSNDFNENELSIATALGTEAFSKNAQNSIATSLEGILLTGNHVNNITHTPLNHAIKN
jgi:antimicrobial peptide system SdpB family protein